MSLSSKLKPVIGNWLSSSVISSNGLVTAQTSHHGQKELLRLHLCRPRLDETSQNDRFSSCKAKATYEYSAGQACMACSPAPSWRPHRCSNHQGLTWSGCWLLCGCAGAQVAVPSQLAELTRPAACELANLAPVT